MCQLQCSTSVRHFRFSVGAVDARAIVQTPSVVVSNTEMIPNRVVVCLASRLIEHLAIIMCTHTFLNVYMHVLSTTAYCVDGSDY